MTTIGVHAPPDIEREYIRAGVEALNKMTGDLPPIASLEFAFAAYRNTNGLGGAE